MSKKFGIILLLFVVIFIGAAIFHMLASDAQAVEPVSEDDPEPVSLGKILSRRNEGRFETQELMKTEPSTAEDTAQPVSLLPRETCEKCELQHCSNYSGFDLVKACQNGPNPELCKRFIDCALQSRCAVEHPRKCYCGSASIERCLAGEADGPCKIEVEDAAESTDAMTVAKRFIDPQFATGNAASLLLCVRDHCPGCV